MTTDTDRAFEEYWDSVYHPLNCDEACQLTWHAAVAWATEREPSFDFRAHLARQRAFSEKTFGPGARTKGVIDHIRKELAEIDADPSDISEWVDVVILALDGAWRAGHSPEQIIAALVAKQDKNEARNWPDWRTAPPDKAIEHDRTKDKPVAIRGTNGGESNG
ncbi:dATP/dGTP pyrophosphohydrolase domain-containing protein [Pseudochelatococcus sp. B33]